LHNVNRLLRFSTCSLVWHVHNMIFLGDCL